MSKQKTITSQAAIAYATANIIPVIEALATLDANKVSQNKLLAYHVFETCMTSPQEKISHAMLEKAINREFDKRVSSKGRKVADYVINQKPFYSPADQEDITVTREQFQGENPELHVMTVYGHIAAYERDQKAQALATLSSVEQALEAQGLPSDMAKSLVNKDDDASKAYVSKAVTEFKPIVQEKTKATKSSLDDALSELVDMVTNGDTQAAYDWLEQAIELLGFGQDGENVTTQEDIAQAA